MEIFINEVSLEGQYLTEIDFREAIKVFNSIFALISQIKDTKFYKDDSNVYANYEAIKGANFQASLNQLRDKSLKTAFVNIVFNKLNPKEWRKEQLHLPEDLFDLLTSDDNYVDVCNTCLAEVAERKLQNDDKQYLLINFINSSFKIVHPDIKDCCIITIVKNSDETKAIFIDGVDCKSALQCWLEDKLALSKIEYSPDAIIPPKDEQTILRDTARFQKTSRQYDARSIYYELNTNRYWYVDNFHFGKGAHIEVFDGRGLHIGESDLQGNIDTAKKDKDKTIDLS
jgi:hypothetical protein